MTFSLFYIARPQTMPVAWLRLMWTLNREDYPTARRPPITGRVDLSMSEPCRRELTTMLCLGGRTTAPDRGKGEQPNEGRGRMIAESAHWPKTEHTPHHRHEELPSASARCRVE